MFKSASTGNSMVFHADMEKINFRHENLWHANEAVSRQSNRHKHYDYPSKAIIRDIDKKVKEEISKGLV